MNVNFVFVRHGYGCHNAISNLIDNNVLSYTTGKKFLESYSSYGKPNNDYQLYDPVLTNVGVDASIYNGCVVDKILHKIPFIYNNQNYNMESFDVVGCSPLIRCMETAYFMTRKWKNPPSKIFVFPLLREIDESSDDKYSDMSLYNMNTTPSYSIKPISEQKEHLKNIGILDYFDFSFVETFPLERIEPGDIKQFMDWFGNYYMRYLNQPNINIFITTHAGVLKDFSNEGFYNNSGFILNTTFEEKKFKIENYISLNHHLKKHDFFKDYKSYNSVNYYCPSDRCGKLCDVSKKTSNSLDHINHKCE